VFQKPTDGRPAESNGRTQQFALPPDAALDHPL